MTSRLQAIATRLQIRHKMIEVQRLAERARERLRHREQLIQDIEIRVSQYTGACHDCGRPVGPRSTRCEKCTRSHNGIPSGENK